MKLADIIKRVEELIKDGQQVVLTAKAWSSGRGSSVDSPMSHAFRTACLSFILKVYGNMHPFYKQFDQYVVGSDPTATKTGIALLQAMKTEFEGGWIFSTKGLVSAEIFSDFFDMASYLLSEDYKDAAAVMIGSVLEEHLRQLCEKHDVPIIFQRDGKDVAKKADVLNAELTRAGVYTKLDQKNVTGWLDLRNKAAHGCYTEYQKSQVELMMQGVTDFIARVSL
ncbi:MAG: hypothetical protein PHF56_23925 [Desulfuromonadaceae bacterium]|nr:hypothetical protein [Desulfuromonadaceae bacterium]